jgi:hypothetical protein
MKSDDYLNIIPPLFISNIWSKGVNKEHINVKLKKKLKILEQTK